MVTKTCLAVVLIFAIPTPVLAKDPNQAVDATPEELGTQLYREPLKVPIETPSEKPATGRIVITDPKTGKKTTYLLRGKKWALEEDSSSSEGN